jgi:hypothetical protein
MLAMRVLDMGASEIDAGLRRGSAGAAAIIRPTRRRRGEQWRAEPCMSLIGARQRARWVLPRVNTPTRTLFERALALSAARARIPSRTEA